MVRKAFNIVEVLDLVRCHGNSSCCCAASVASEQQHKQDLRRIYKGDTNSRIHHFLPECIAFNQNALRHFLPECIAPRTTQSGNWGREFIANNAEQHTMAVICRIHASHAKMSVIFKNIYIFTTHDEDMISSKGKNPDISLEFIE